MTFHELHLKRCSSWRLCSWIELALHGNRVHVNGLPPRKIRYGDTWSHGAIKKLETAITLPYDGFRVWNIKHVQSSSWTQKNGGGKWVISFWKKKKTSCWCHQSDLICHSPHPVHWGIAETTYGTSSFGQFPPPSSPIGTLGSSCSVLGTANSCEAHHLHRAASAGWWNHHGFLQISSRKKQSIEVGLFHAPQSYQLPSGYD